MMESRVGSFSSRIKDTKSKVQKSSGSIMSRASKTQDMLDELDQPVSYFTDKISEFDFGDISLKKILKEGESLRPKTRAEGVGAAEINKSSTWKEMAEKSLIKFEGFKGEAYWDVDHYRVGYGTDTLYDESGKPIEVTQNTVVSKEQALKSLRKRITEDFVPIIKNSLGDSWDGLSDHAKAATVSITYNYGRVPERIRGALKSGDNNAIANAILELADDNDGVNKNRRIMEAELVKLSQAQKKNKSLVERRKDR
jgi:GH24 family phage-related lysozyme (muramidase)